LIFSRFGQTINNKIKKLDNVRYIELDTNIGRSAIRNQLAENASFNYLLFLDCDSEISDNEFLIRYIPYCASKAIVFGGRIYSKQISDAEKYLRWYYGRSRKSTDAKVRKRFPNRSFMTNNFLISKDLINFIKFESKLKLYGHEDTLMGYQLKKAGIIIQHIDNPLIHVGLESASDFIRKTEEGLSNLLNLYFEYGSDPLFIEDIKIIKWFQLLVKTRMIFILQASFKMFRGFYINNLKGAKPSLFIFDLYKLGYLCSLYDKNKT